MKKLILGISGLAGSGKDTLAEKLPGFTRVAMADPLKRICKDVYDFSDLQLWGPSPERSKPDERYPREAHTFGKANAEGNLTCACCGYIYPSEAILNREPPRPCFLTPRYALQLLGTEWGRECYQNTWVQKCLRTAETLLTEDGWRYDPRTGLNQHLGGTLGVVAEVQGVAVTDVRFLNEIRGIRAGGGRVLRIVRPGAGLKGSAGLHPSEAEMASIPDSEFDAVLMNDRTLEEMIEDGRALVDVLRASLG